MDRKRWKGLEHEIQQIYYFNHFHHIIAANIMIYQSHPLEFADLAARGATIVS